MLFSKLHTAVYGVGGVAIAALLAASVYLHKERNAAIERVGRVQTQLEQALEVNKENERNVEIMQNTIRAQAEELRTLADKYNDATISVRRMQTMLRNIRMEDLATQNPAMLQDEINQRTQEFIEELARETRDFSGD